MSNTLLLTPLLPRARRSNAIATELRRLIACGQLKPGDQLPTETTLCQQFGVSRTTLREAVQMLRTTGLLDVTPGRGSFIRVPDIRQLLADFAIAGQAGGNIPAADVAQLRLLIQRHAMAGMARVQPVQRKELYQNVLNRIATAEENAAAEAAWHLHMVTLAGTPLMGMIMQMLLAMDASRRVERYRNPDEVLRAIHIQMRTNAAIVDGDFDLADRVLTQFLMPGGTGAAQQSTPLPSAQQHAAA